MFGINCILPGVVELFLLLKILQGHSNWVFARLIRWIGKLRVLIKILLKEIDQLSCPFGLFGPEYYGIKKSCVEQIIE